MALPTSRNTTYTAGAQVKSADLDAIQDCIIGNKHGTLTYQCTVAPNLTSLVAAPDQTFTATSTVPITLPVGKRITALRAYVKDNVTGPTKITLQLGSATAGTTSYTIVSSAPISAGSGALQTVTVTGLTTTIASGTVYGAILVISGGTGICHVYGIEADFDQL